MRYNLLIGAAAATLALSAAAMGYAQDRDGSGPADRQAMRQQFQQRMQARREQRLADLRQLLHLRPDQEGAFQALQTALRPQPRQRGEERGGAELTTPQMLARRAQRAAERKAEMDRRDQAILAFYNGLSPDQQKTFDAMVRLRRHELLGGRGMGMEGHGGGRWMGRGDGPPPPPR